MQSIIETVAGSVMARLRAETRELHERAEHHPFQQRLIAGTVTRDGYVQLLGQMYFVHGALEQHLQRLAAGEPAIGAVMRDWCYRTARIDDDLRQLGASAHDLNPLRAAARLIDTFNHAAANQPFALLGYHYVLEGSKNGSKFIAKHLRRMPALSDGRALSYMDPDGDMQTVHWQEYKSAMDGCTFSDEQMDTIVEAAKEMFRGVTAVYDDVDGAAGAV